jgi:iron complex outermembrane receptor protein
MVWFYAAVLLTYVSASFAFAESKEVPASQVTMGEILVTAERISDFIKNHPQDVAVVDRKEIIQRGLLNTEEVLKTMPGVEVSKSTGTGSRISIRGSGKSNGVLVLLNGRPLNTNQYGGVDISSIPIEMIESVTVFKPPVPVWLGPGASEGAINIQTRDLTTSSREKKEPSTTIMVGGGSFGLVQGSGSEVVSLGDGKFLFTGSASHRDGKRENSDMDDASFSASWNREDKGGKRYEANSRYYTADYASSGPADNPTPDAWQRYRKASFDGRFSGPMGEKGTYSLVPDFDLTALSDHSQSGFTSTLTDYKAGFKGRQCGQIMQGSGISGSEGLQNMMTLTILSRSTSENDARFECEL